MRKQTFIGINNSRVSGTRSNHKQQSWLFKTSWLTEGIKKTWRNFSRGSSSNSSDGRPQVRATLFPFKAALKPWSLPELCHSHAPRWSWSWPTSQLDCRPASPLWTCLANTDPGHYAQSWLWSWLDFPAWLCTYPVITDLLGSLAPGLNPTTLIGTNCLTWGMVRLVPCWWSHCFFWPPFPEGTALSLQHSDTELQQLKRRTSISWETKPHVWALCPHF